MELSGFKDLRFCPVTKPNEATNALERNRPPGVSARLTASRKGFDRPRVAPIEPFMPPPSRIGRPRKSDLRGFVNVVVAMASTG